MKSDKWLLNEENNKRFAIMEKSKRGWGRKIICDICGNETDENNQYALKILKVRTSRGNVDIPFTLCTKCLNIIEGITDPIIAIANTGLIKHLNPDLWLIIKARIEEKEKERKNKMKLLNEEMEEKK